MNAPIIQQPRSLSSAVTFSPACVIQNTPKSTRQYRKQIPNNNRFSHIYTTKPFQPSVHTPSSSIQDVTPPVNPIQTYVSSVMTDPLNLPLNPIPAYASSDIVDHNQNQSANLQ